MEKTKCRGFDPIINPHKDYIDLFEDDEPPEREVKES